MPDSALEVFHYTGGYDFWCFGDCALGGTSSARTFARKACRDARRSKDSLKPCARKACARLTLPRRRQEGFFTGRFAVNPFPAGTFLYGSLILCSRIMGTGAVMCRTGPRPARLRVAEKYHLPVKIVVQPINGPAGAARSNERSVHGTRQAGGFGGLTRA